LDALEESLSRRRTTTFVPADGSPAHTALAADDDGIEEATYGSEMVDSACKAVGDTVDEGDAVLWCPVCLELMCSPALLQCGHLFCTLCIQTHLLLRVTDAVQAGVGVGVGGEALCPLCRGYCGMEFVADTLLDAHIWQRFPALSHARVTATVNSREGKAMARRFTEAATQYEAVEARRRAGGGGGGGGGYVGGWSEGRHGGRHGRGWLEVPGADDLNSTSAQNMVLAVACAAIAVQLIVMWCT
jgi:hypothetical protein